MTLEINTPTLLLDEIKCRDNIREMCQKAKEEGIRFRPHFKTHQSHEIGHWFREEGVTSITVSSVKMARYFARDGWRDITISFPVNIREIPEINELAGRINLHLLIAGTEVINLLEKGLHHRVFVWLKIDTGYHRTGFPVENREETGAALKQIDASPHLQLKGFLSHTGNTYHAVSVAEIRNLFAGSVRKLNELRTFFTRSFNGLEISMGDTPSASLSNNFNGIDELRPGNFVFYDLMQFSLGACQLKDIAVALVCPVVAIYPERQEVVLYGGAVHLSKETLLINRGTPVYGMIMKYTGTGWESTGGEDFLIALSQEHGIAKINTELMSELHPGDLVAVLPVHSCLTANLMKGYLGITGRHYDHLEGSPDYNLPFHDTQTTLK